MSIADGSDFDGDTYVRRRDHARLSSQLDRLYRCMSGGGWQTLEEMTRIVGAPQTSVSARLRDLRKPKFGGHQIERRARGERARGLFEYRLVPHQLDWTQVVHASAKENAPGVAS